MKTPARPPDWNFTIADLMAEVTAGKRSGIKQPELDWARDYERSLIPAGMRFPEKGDVYEPISDTLVTYLTAWSAPCTGSGEGVLKQGEEIIVDQAPRDARPIGVYLVALDYEAIERRLVPAKEREQENYGGFYFFISTVDLNTKFIFKRKEAK